MEIIDVHIHVGHRQEWTEEARKLWMDMGPYVPHIFDGEGQQLPEAYGETLKAEGVVGGILLPEYSPQTAGVMPFSRTLEICRLHPEFVPFANLNPHIHEDLLGTLVEQLSRGARGLKLHPVHGLFFANDPRLYPVYEFCEKQELPLFFHAGSSVFPKAKLRYADPYTFDDIIKDFPRLTVILCHGGRGFWYQIAEYLAKTCENVYIDISGLPPQNILLYYPNLKKFPEKFLFGSDFPGVPGIRKNAQTLARIVKNPKLYKRLCYQNAYDLFGFWREGIFEVRNKERLKEVLPAELVRGELFSGRIYGYRKEEALMGAIALEKERDFSFITCLYVRERNRRRGIGSCLLRFVLNSLETPTVYAWANSLADENFLKKHGFSPADERERVLCSGKPNPFNSVLFLLKRRTKEEA